MFERWQLELIASARIAHLATIAADGRPAVLPVCFVLHHERFFSAIDEKPKRGTPLARLRNIARDRRVTLLVDRYEEDWRRLCWLRIDGVAAVLPRGEIEPSALDALRHKYSQYATMALESLPLIAITPERVSSWHP